MAGVSIAGYRVDGSPAILRLPTRFTLQGRLVLSDKDRPTTAMEENALWPLLTADSTDLGSIADGSQLGPVARRHLDARTVVDHVFRP
jgi:hypothetical protein